MGKATNGRSMTMFSLIFITLVILLLLPMAFIIGYYSNALFNLVVDFTVEQSSSKLNQLKNTVTMQTSQVAISFAALTRDLRFSSAFDDFSDPPPGTSGLEAVRQMDRIIDSYLNYFSENIRSLMVIPAHGEPFVYRHNLAMRSDGILVLAAGTPDRVVVSGVEESRAYLAGEDLILLAIHPERDLGYEGIEAIILALQPNIFEGMLIRTRQNQSRVYILDGAGRSLITPADNEPGFSDEILATLRHLAGESGTYRNLETPSGSAMVTAESNHRGWLFVEAIPEPVIARRISQVSGRVLTTAMVIFLLFTVAFVFLIRYQLRPLKRLADHMNLVDRHPLVAYDGPSGARETATLAASYNGMITQIHRLIDEVKENEARLRESEIDVLLAQLNPHFIINTLNCIRITARLNGEPVLERMLNTLCRLLSKSLGHTELYIPIGEELDFLRDYVDIMKLRYGDIFDLELDIAPDAGGARILKFLIQPLVENSIVHGLNRKEDGDRGRLSVVIRRKADDLEVTVEDNGIGLEGMDIGDPDNSGEDADHYGIGLRSVRDRIQYRFGDGYRVVAADRPEGGACITFRMPYLEGEERL